MSVVRHVKFFCSRFDIVSNVGVSFDMMDQSGSIFDVLIDSIVKNGSEGTVANDIPVNRCFCRCAQYLVYLVF